MANRTGAAMIMFFIPVIGALFRKVNYTYLCMFCFAVSLWGVVMLVVLGISCKLRAVALFEDVHIEKGKQQGNHTDDFSLRKENVDEGYDNAAWSCFGAAVFYGFFLILSTVFLIYQRRKKVS